MNDGARATKNWIRQRVYYVMLETLESACQEASFAEVPVLFFSLPDVIIERLFNNPHPTLLRHTSFSSKFQKAKSENTSSKWPTNRPLSLNLIIIVAVKVVQVSSIAWLTNGVYRYIHAANSNRQAIPEGVKFRF
jgi:hypothetical protein